MLHAQRASGILLAISSLPGEYGIGSLGRSARNFVDFLVQAGQKYWQVLPLVPPGDGASPYMSPSAFAGNPYFIDLDALAEAGLLTAQQLASARMDNPDRVDYEWLRRTRLPLLYEAWLRSLELGWTPAAIPQLEWLPDYAAFAALHDQYKTAFPHWPQDAVPDADLVKFHSFLQTVFYSQWFALKNYANARGVRLIGDIPIYLSPDSVEMWRHPELFQLDEHGAPAAVAGVPPDAFSDAGQLWGNPLYNWSQNHRDVVCFWQKRIGWCARLFDAVRIDHFRAFHTYWSIPAGAVSAAEGHWEPGPGQPLLDTLRATAPQLQLIAEDLGDLDADALNFVRTCGIPGMKVLVFAFESGADSAYLPHNCQGNCVVYTGTHDTPTFVQWLATADASTAHFARSYLRLREDEGLGWGAIAGAWATGATLAMAPMQDVLGLGADARMNTPGTQGAQNWSWRVRMDALNHDVASRLYAMTKTYCR